MDESVSPAERALALLDEWIQSQPAWLRRAYHLMATRREITDHSLDELVRICKAEELEGDMEWPTAGSAGVPRSAVKLRAVSRVRGVNAIEHDARLEMPNDGLFVVYGDNGAGKSGYARILRHACRSRAASPQILRNIYDPDAAGPASAALELEVDGVIRTSLWSDRDRVDEALRNISVFDADAAVAQVSSANEIAFKPDALYLLEQLAAAAGRVKSKLEVERDLKRATSRKDHLMRAFGPSTPVGRAVAGLNGSTAIEKVRQVAGLNAAEAARLERLRVDLAAEPAVRARQVRGQATHLESIRRQLQQADELFGPQSVEEARRLHDEAVSTSQASRAAAKTAFDAEDLPGVGGAAWRHLWEAARRFSTIEAYPGETFPRVSPGSRCVLCLQELTGVAPDRLARFEAYVRADVQRRSTAAKQEADVFGARLLASRLPQTRRLLAPVLAELGALERDVRSRLLAQKLNRRAALRVLAGKEVRSVPLGPSVEPELSAAIENLRSRAATLETASASSARSELVAEFQDLEDRRLLAGQLDAIEAEIAVQRDLDGLDRAIRTTDTAPITRKSTSLAKDLVTPGLRDAFAKELQQLKVVSARVELLSVGGHYGAQRYQVKLLADPETPPLQVLSEGEHRAVALAGFLSELSTASHCSTVVLDDPVSSLDNRWRRHVADRLVEEAKTRQVIVFTHDAVFLMNLMEASDARGLPLDVVHLARRGTTVGIPRQGAPWHAMKLSDRLAYLNRRLQEVEAELNAGNDDTYRSAAHDLYGLLREAWERAVEEVLLNRVVVRFGREVQTSRLKPLVDITDADLKTIDNAMTKASRYIRGHDDAPAIADDPPQPDELRADIGELANWTKEMRKRGRH